MRFIEIMETLDSALPLHWEDHSQDDLDLHQAKFSIDDGHFIVEFKKPYYNPGIWELKFTRNGELDLTGTGNATTVLATVMEAVRQFIQHYDPKTITFAAKKAEASRTRLYPRLFAMLLREFPHYVRADDRGTRQYTEYTASRPSKPFTPKPEPSPAPESKPMSAEEWDEIEQMLADLRN